MKRCAPAACTVIPSDLGDVHNIPIRYSTFNNLLSCVEICGQGPTTPGLQVHHIDLPTSKSGLGPADRTFYQKIYEAMKANPNCCHFLVANSALFVACIQAMMLWCLYEEERAVSIYIVDPEFNRPAGWSYRYFWRHQAKSHKGGLSINHVGIIAQEAARICQATL